MFGSKGISQPSPVLSADQHILGQRHVTFPSSTPQQVPQAVWTRPQLAAPAASSKALDYFRPLQAKFVRPDTDEPASDILAAFISRSSQPAAAPEKPLFRTALEQVSYETNSSRMFHKEAKPRGLGLLGRAAKIFGK